MLLNPLSRWLYLIALIFITSVKIQCQNIAETDNIQPFNQIKLMGNVRAQAVIPVHMLKGAVV